MDLANTQTDSCAKTFSTMPKVKLDASRGTDLVRNRSLLTVNELAAALGNDANFSATITKALAGKLAKASNLSNLADVVTARAKLGHGSMAVQNAGAMTITDGIVDSVALDG